MLSDGRRMALSLSACFVDFELLLVLRPPSPPTPIMCANFDETFYDLTGSGGRAGLAATLFHHWASVVSLESSSANFVSGIVAHLARGKHCAAKKCHASAPRPQSTIFTS